MQISYQDGPEIPILSEEGAKKVIKIEKHGQNFG